MYFFKIIIPTDDKSNTAGTVLNDAIQSVLTQTFTNYYLIVSHDNHSRDINIRADGVFNSYHKAHLYNGGNKNSGMNVGKDGTYTLFLGDTDVLASNTILEELHDFIVRNAYPELIRLPYKKMYAPGTRGVIKRYGGEKTVEDLAKSSRVAAWTKCVNSELVQPFPNNTYFEDVVQHIAQADVIERFAIFDKPVIENRLYNTREEDDSTSIKFHSSRLRLVAELMDLELKHEYAYNVRKSKIDFYIRGLFNDYRNDNQYFSNMTGIETTVTNDDTDNDTNETE